MEDSGDDYRQLLEKHRVEIVKSLDLDRQYMLSHLRSKFVLDDEDSQMILNAGPSRQQKTSKFIDILATKGPRAFSHFIQGLEIDHPHLYEVVTGQRPLGKYPNTTPSQVIPWSVLTDKQLLDYDREYLVKELAKMCEANTTMAYMQKKLMTEKHLVEKKYGELMNERVNQDAVIKDMQAELDRKLESSVRKTDDWKELQKYVNHCQELTRDSVEKSNIIINLQSRLLAVTEDIENNTKRNEELRRKNESLMQQVRDLTINYDWQRTQSKRLYAQVDQNNDALRKANSTQNETYQLKFQLAHVTEERDEALHRMNEFKNVMQALNVKLDMLQQEKSSEELTRGQVSEQHLQMKENINKLEEELKEEKNRVESFRRRNERLRQEIETHKEQRDFYLTEREHAIRNRDQVTKERDEALRFNRELQKSRDEAVRKQIEMASQFEKRSADAALELENLREENKKMELSIMMYQNDLNKLKTESKESKLIEPSDESSTFNSDDETQEDETMETAYPWRDRTKTEVLQSAYRKLDKKNKPNPHQLKPLKYREMFMVYDTLSGLKSPVSEVMESQLLFTGVNASATVEKGELSVTKKAVKKSNMRHHYHTIQNLYPVNPGYDMTQNLQFTAAEVPSNDFLSKSFDDSQHRKVSRQPAMSPELSKRRSASMLPLPKSGNFSANELFDGMPKSPKPEPRVRANAIADSRSTHRKSYPNDERKKMTRRASEPDRKSVV